MTLLETHPDLPAEQAYIAHAYRCMEAMYERVAATGPHGRNDFEIEAFERWKTARMASLGDQISALVFGRIDQADGERFYIGRHHVFDDERATMVVDWRAPVARSFYRAGARDPMGLRQRRQFLLDGREVLGIADDDFTAGDRVRGEEILQAELKRQTPGRMRDIVATIQAEQDLIIRAPLEGLIIVQGGPGTGKTAIGLHRASYLLFEHREALTRSKVLVVGPNPTFMAYISQVLPSLGETAVRQHTIDELAPIVATVAATDPVAERVKGDARMATVLRRALDARIAPPAADVPLGVHGARVTVEAAAVREEVQRMRSRAIPHADARAQLRDALLMRVYRAYQRRLRPGSLPLDYDTVAREVRADPVFKGLLDRAWGTVGAKALVTEVLTKPEVLARAADGVLDADERAAILRRRGRAGRWTNADRVLLDEASALIDGPPERFGHVVVDEAQDLSPMQLRAVARRAAGSMTILGDLGQATGPWAHRSWDEVAAHVPGGEAARIEELTLGYRVAPAIMEVARAVLARSMPALRAPDSVRAEPGEVHIAPAEDVTAAAARLAAALVARVDFAAVIAPDAMLERLGDGRLTDARERLGERLTLVPASIAKGLEFDGVLLVEPSAIVEQGGLNLLYICLTRAMRSLVLVHAAPLPEVLRAA